MRQALSVFPVQPVAVTKILIDFQVPLVIGQSRGAAGDPVVVRAIAPAWRSLIKVRRREIRHQLLRGGIDHVPWPRTSR